MVLLAEICTLFDVMLVNYLLWRVAQLSSPIVPWFRVRKVALTICRSCKSVVIIGNRGICSTGRGQYDPTVVVCH